MTAADWHITIAGGRLAHNKVVRDSKKGDVAMNTSGWCEVPVHGRLAIAELAPCACRRFRLGELEFGALKRRRTRPISNSNH